MAFPVPAAGLGTPSRYGPLDLAARPLPPWMTAASDGTTPLQVPGGGDGPARPAGVAPQLPAGPPPASLMSPGTPEPAFTPAPVRPLAAVDPLRPTGSVGEDAGLIPPGEVIRVDPNDPRSRNPFLFLTEATDAAGKGTGRAQWQSSMQQSSFGPNGFTPGFMAAGVGGQQQWAGSPADALMVMQQQAQAAGLDPRANLNAFASMLTNGAQSQNAANLEAQRQNTLLGTTRMQVEGQRANTAAEQAGRERVAGIEAASRDNQARMQMLGAAAAAFGQNPNMNPQVLETIGRLTSGPPPAGLPAGPAPAGLVPGGQPGGALGGIADQARNNQFVQGLRSAFPMNPDGTPAVGQPITPQHAAAFLDHLQAGNPTPEQRQAVYNAINTGQMGDRNAVRNAILQATAVAHYRAAPPVDPATGAPAFGGWGSLVRPSGRAAPYAVAGPDGRPVMTFQVDPNSNAVAHGAATFLAHGTPYNQVVGPNGQTVSIGPTDLRQVFAAGGATQADRNRAAQGAALLQMFGQPPAALAPR